MNSFDYAIIKFINQFSAKSWAFDKIIGFLAGNNLYKGGVLIALIWWAWFKREDRHTRNREHILSTLLSCVVAIFLGKVLASILPFRLRPIHEASLRFLLPFDEHTIDLEGWSSFPSDHAALFFTISVGLLFIAKRVGLFALFYTILFILFPRVYLGYHYPSDIIVGAMIGTITALIGNIYFVKNKNIRSIIDWSYAKPHIFYPLFFLLTYQVVDLFYNLRTTAHGISELIKRIIA